MKIIFRLKKKKLQVTQINQKKLIKILKLNKIKLKQYQKLKLLIMLINYLKKDCAN